MARIFSSRISLFITGDYETSGRGGKGERAEILPLFPVKGKEK
jgi:hypothetical protein